MAQWLGVMLIPHSFPYSCQAYESACEWYLYKCWLKMSDHGIRSKLLSSMSAIKRSGGELLSRCCYNEYFVSSLWPKKSEHDCLLHNVIRAICTSISPHPQTCHVHSMIDDIQHMPTIWMVTNFGDPLPTLRYCSSHRTARMSSMLVGSVLRGQWCHAMKEISSFFYNYYNCYTHHRVVINLALCVYVWCVCKNEHLECGM